jgi:eukaryotic-like serine/threonine-protein kinase
VWLGRRSDGRFEGFAAVKLLNTSLVGPAGEERFTREGTILARLSHPSIAHLVDAGVAWGSQPYLVLEYVHGNHIDTYCDERRLTVDARIRLFLDVLAAVAHAHANLVVHRDIKPSNVLVSADTATGGHRVKLLDFGIAKMIEGDADATAVMTRHSGLALTPAFAAPEQLTGGAVTTATDVYSLGVLLYLLLGGRHPAGAELSSPARLISFIAESEAPRLLDAIGKPTEEGNADLASIAMKRGTTRDKLRRALQGDLETIVATALKKDPRERYSSVAAFADDLQRYLDERPIRARPDAWTYRAAKFVRRHRAAVALGALVVMALVAGVVGTATQAQRAAKQAAIADTQRRRADAQRDFAMRQLSRAEAINDLNAFLLSDAAPSGKPFTVGDLLAHAERIASHAGGESAQNRVDMLTTIGRQYEMQDEHATARRVLGQAYELARTLPEPSMRAKAGCNYALVIALGGDSPRGEVLWQTSERDLPREPEFALDRITCLLRGSSIAQERGDMKVGVERAEAAEQLRRESPMASALLRLVVSMRMAESYRMAARFREANAAFDDSFAQLRSLGREDTERAGTLLNNWGMTLYQLGRPLEAERMFRRVIQISSADGTEETVSPMLMNNLARVLRNLHRLPAARDYADRAYAKAREAGHQVVIVQSLGVRASIYRMMGDFPRAQSTLGELAAEVKAHSAPGHISFGRVAEEEALLLAARGDLPSALAGSDRALAIPQAKNLHDYVAEFLMDRVGIELAMQRLDDAHKHAEQALEYKRSRIAEGDLSADVGHAYLLLGRALLAQRQGAKARAAFGSAVEHLAPTIGADHPDTLLAERLALQSSR